MWRHAFSPIFFFFYIIHTTSRLYQKWNVVLWYQYSTTLLFYFAVNLTNKYHLKELRIYLVCWRSHRKWWYMFFIGIEFFDKQMLRLTSSMLPGTYSCKMEIISWLYSSNQLLMALKNTQKFKNKNWYKKFNCISI